MNPPAGSSDGASERARMTPEEARALDRAFELATRPGFRSGGNPRVGCVLLAESGRIVAEGWHRGAGSEHAEAMAVRLAGPRARGATAVVTLEPCDHTGRTGPCTAVLIDAGVRRVVFAQSDPDPIAAGGAATLRRAGLDLVGPVDPERGRSLNPMWSSAVERGRPFVILKLATSLDGRIAAPDGSSRWITGPDARRAVHELRAEVDAVMVGTGTVLADDPQLTVRIGSAPDATPLRVVVGLRRLPADARIFDGPTPGVHLETRDLDAALARLHERGVRSVLVEGGSGLATEFVRRELIDRLEWHVAPIMLGAGGGPALGDLGIDTIAGCLRWRTESVRQLGDDVVIRLRSDRFGVS